MVRRKKWIKCRVSSGMFSDERTVEVSGRSFFVHEKSIRNVKEDGFGELEVAIVEIDGQTCAIVPTSTRETVPLGA